MEVTNIRKVKTGYKLLGQLTTEDTDEFLNKVDKDVINQLLDKEFPIENLVSVKGFWFRRV